jgi:hypothetical protein
MMTWRLLWHARLLLSVICKKTIVVKKIVLTLSVYSEDNISHSEDNTVYTKECISKCKMVTLSVCFQKW